MFVLIWKNLLKNYKEKDKKKYIFRNNEETLSKMQTI